MKFMRRCPFCGEMTIKDINVTAEQIRKYENREGLIQNIFPTLSASEREFIKTGYCDECQEMLFAPPED